MAKVFSCPGCTKRYVGCHSDCFDYMLEKEVYTTRKTKAHDEHSADKYLTDRRIREANKNAVRRKRYSYKIRRTGF